MAQDKANGNPNLTESDLQKKYEQLCQIKDELERAETMYRFLAENSPDALWRLDAQFRFEYVSPAVVDIIGYQIKEIIGRHLFSILTPESVEKVKQGFAERNYFIKTKQKWGGSVYTVEVMHKEGHCIYAEVTVNPIFNSENQLIGYTGVTRDISERHRQEKSMYQYAFYDHLTTLPNRRMLDIVLEREVSRNKEAGNIFSVLFIDIDEFKEINDTYGHAAGDATLRIVAKRIRNAIRKDDFVARLAGDEFIAVLPGLGDHNAAGHTLTRLLEHCRQPIILADKKVYISISIGISFFPADADNVIDLMGYADQAMYKAKRSGGCKCVCYSQM